VRFALIPVKELGQAKARLAPVLDAEARRELALAMFRDVLEAALTCRVVEGVGVVTTDETVAAIATEAGAEVMPEPGGLNEALTSAAEKLRERGVDQLLVLAADLPLIDADLLSGEFEAEPDADAGVAAADDFGTNAIWMPNGAFTFQFGPHSGERHADAAEAAGLLWVWIRCPHLKLDIDTPEDLRALGEAIAAGESVGRHTREALKAMRPVVEST